MPIVNRIAAMADEITEWRRDLHEHPELLYEVHRTAGIAVVGPERVDANTTPRMAGEDFSFLLEARPGVFVLLGTGDGEACHHPGYRFNDAVSPQVSSFWVRLIERSMPV